MSRGPALARWALAALLALLGLIGLLAALGSAPVLRTLLPVQSEGLQGHLASQLQARELSGATAQWRWRAQGVRWQWQGWRAGAVQAALHLERLDLEPLAADRAPLDPESLLAALRWPLGLHLAPLRIDELRLAGAPLGALRVELGVAQGQQALRLDAFQAQGLGRAQGLTVQGQASLGTDGAVKAQGQARRGAAQLDARAQGTLAQLPVHLHLSGPAEAQAQAEVAPLAAQPLRALNAQFSRLDPQALHPAAPAGDWSGRLNLQAQAEEWQLGAEATNARAQRLDQQGWPLRRVLLRLRLNPAQWQRSVLDALDLDLGTGRDPGQGAGRVTLHTPSDTPRSGQPWRVRVRLAGLRPERLHAQWPVARLEGDLSFSQARFAADDEPLLATLALQGGGWHLGAQGELLGQSLNDVQLRLEHGAARITAAGDGSWRENGWQAQVQAQVQQWPLALKPWAEPSLIDGRGQARWVQQARSAEGQWQVQLGPATRWAGLPLSGEWEGQAGPTGGRWRLRVAAPAASAGERGADQLALHGATPAVLRGWADLATAAAWQPHEAQWQVAELARWQALWKPWLAQAQGRSSGRWQAASPWPLLQLDAAGLSLQAPGGRPWRAEQLTLRLETAAAEWRAQGVEGQGWRVAQTEGRWQGGTVQAQAQGQAPGSAWARVLGRSDGAEPLPWRLDLNARQAAAGTWESLALRLGPPEVAAPSWLRLEGGTWQWADGRLRGQQAVLRVLDQALQLQDARVDPGASAVQLQLSGRPQLAPWLDAIDPRVRWRGDASAQLDLDWRWIGGPAGHGSGFTLKVQGLKGDLRLDGEPLHLRQLAVQAEREPGPTPEARTALSLSLDSPALGRLSAELRSEAQGERLSGQLSAHLPRLQALQAWWPAWVLDGEAQVQARVAGTLQDPRLQGEATLNLARVQHPASGFSAQQARLRAQFNEDRLRIEPFQLAGPGDGGGGGLVRGEGELRWGAGDWQGHLAVQAEQWRVLNRFDRQLSLSGRGELTLDARRLRGRGAFTADQGLFDLGQMDRPQLDDDVAVLAREAGAAAPPKSSPWSRDLDLQLDLGQRLRVQGRGFASRLTGHLRLVEQGGKAPHWSGRIDTQGGRYKAYGQTLDLETGELRFNGSLDNPGVALLAIKPDVEHRVGVSVSGSALAPRARLFSEPELPDKDVLAWLLLGRDPAELESRDTALLQRAALAVLSGEGENPASQLMDRLGLTELSLSPDDDAGAVLRVGAQLSKRWTLGYERSLNATSGSWQLIYRLGQRFRLRAQSGTDSAVDLLWLWRFD